jgi:hypothetical protein
MFEEPVLLGTARLQMAGQPLRVKTYGERAGRSGEAQAVPGEVAMCKAMARILFAHYPGHPWSVEVHAEQGYAFITIPPLLGANYGYILHLDKIDTQDSFVQGVKEAGGNLLERFSIPRSSIDIAHYLALEQKHPLLGNYRSNRKHRALIPS